MSSKENILPKGQIPNNSVHRFEGHCVLYQEGAKKYRKLSQIFNARFNFCIQNFNKDFDIYLQLSNYYQFYFLVSLYRPGHPKWKYIMWKFEDFLPLRFYVKSNLVILKPQIL